MLKTQKTSAPPTHSHNLMAVGPASANPRGGRELNAPPGMDVVGTRRDKKRVS